MTNGQPASAQSTPAGTARLIWKIFLSSLPAHVARRDPHAAQTSVPQKPPKACHLHLLTAPGRVATDTYLQLVPGMVHSGMHGHEPGVIQDCLTSDQQNRGQMKCVPGFPQSWCCSASTRHSHGEEGRVALEFKCAF